jgi:integrase
MPISDMRPVHIRRLFDDLIRAGRCDGRGGLAPKSLQIARTVLTQAWAKALDAELVTRNVIAHRPRAAPPGRPHDRDPRPKTNPRPGGDRHAYRSQIQGHQGEFPIECPLLTRMRISEALGMTWSNIDNEAAATRLKAALDL